MRVSEELLYQKVFKKSCFELELLNNKVELYCLKSKKKPVYGTGFPLAEIFFIKDFPANIEIKEGIAFGAQSIEKLLTGLRRLSIEDKFSYFTNFRKCSNCKEEDIDKKCLEFLKEEIDIIKPKVIVVLGEYSEKAICKVLNLKITGNNNFTHTPLADLIFGVDFKGVFNDHVKKKKLWEDLKKIKKSRL